MGCEESPPRPGSRILKSNDAKQAALNMVLMGGANRIMWDECSLVWGSRNLIDTTIEDTEQVSF